MKKKRISGICLVLVLALGMCIGAAAANNLETISAYLNRGITIKLDGQTQTMYDAQGNRVYPISYNGTTYVPIRAVSNMLGIDVEWDGANNTVLLGETGTAKDFIEAFEPYAGVTWTHYSISDKNTQEIAGKTYDHFIEIYDDFDLYYDLAGKYDTLTFDVYAPESYEYTLYFYGDNDTLLEKINVEGKNLPVTHEVNVSGTQQLKIEAEISGFLGSSGRYIYIFNATIE